MPGYKVPSGEDKRRLVARTEGAEWSGQDETRLVVRKEGAGWTGQKARVHRREGKRLVVGTEGAERLKGKKAPGRQDRRRRLAKTKTECADWLGQ